MRYLRRDADGNVIGHYANEQDYARELVADDHPDLVKYRADTEKAISAAKKNNPVKKLQAQVAKLEAIIKKLEKA